MNIEDEIYSYEEKMLRLQYDKSELISHKLTRGEIREDYIKDYVKKKIKTLNIEKGQIISNGIELEFQLDFIVCNPEGEIHRMGSHAIVNAKACSHIFEIKSKLKTQFLKELNQKAQRIKQLNENIVIGILSYQLDISERTLLKKFGFSYDKDIDTYFNDFDINSNINNIDYVIVIGEETGLIIIKEKDRYNYYKETPVIKYFIDLLRGNRNKL